MADGMTWSAYWSINGRMDDGGSIINDTWVGGEAGRWWVCIHNDDGLDDGLYELSIEVESETLLTDAIFVGGNHPPVQLTLVNQTDRRSGTSSSPPRRHRTGDRTISVRPRS